MTDKNESFPKLIENITYIPMYRHNTMIETGDAKSFNNGTAGLSQKILKQTSLDVKMVDLAYNIGADEGKIKEIIAELSTKGLEYHNSTYGILGENNSGKLQGAIFVDESHKTINVALAGTRYNTFSNLFIDLLDDAMLAIGLNTYKTESLVQLNEYITKSFKEELEGEWKVHYTGHSLGGHSANVAANLMATKGVVNVKDISTTTFDSAGGNTAFRNAAILGGHKPYLSEKACLFEGENISFDSRPNRINQVDYKTETKVYTVYHDKHGPNTLFSYNPLQLLKEHSLDNFIELFSGSSGYIKLEDGSQVTYNPNQELAGIDSNLGYELLAALVA